MNYRYRPILIRYYSPWKKFYSCFQIYILKFLTDLITNFEFEIFQPRWTFSPLLKQSLLITLFVLSMMLIIEYLNVLTRGIWSKSLKTSPAKQILLATILGLIPGCLGAYTAVSLYVHNIIGTGALVAAMISTSGDEAFFMFSIIPSTAVILHGALFAIAIAAGFVVNAIYRKKESVHPQKHFHLHDEEPNCVCFDRNILTITVTKL